MTLTDGESREKAIYLFSPKKERKEKEFMKNKNHHFLNIN
jgi:hypothetical protein